MPGNFEIVPNVKSEIVLASGVETWMQAIRSEWKERRLIQRVQTLLPTDPSSACQRILNARPSTQNRSPRIGHSAGGRLSVSIAFRRQV